MSAFDTADIRNVGLIGHGESGKTTLASSLLYATGAIDRLGRVEEGNTVTDYEEEEVARQDSLSAALAHAAWKGKKINLIDTPGRASFVHEANAALRVADTALTVVCGVAGVEVQTEKTWRFSESHGLAQIVLINKLDRERADFGRSLEAMQKAFGRHLVPVHLPIGSETTFRGIVDLLAGKAFLYADDHSGKGKEAEIPEDLVGAAKAARERIMEAVAEIDDRLMEIFLEKGALPDDQILDGLRRGIRERRIVPVLAASALKGFGMDRLAEFMVTCLPSPAERGAAKGRSADGTAEVEREVATSAPLSLFVFKTVADPFAGRISLLRVMSGTVRLDQHVINYRSGADERLANLSILQGKDLAKAEELRAGDLGCVPKLKDTTTGDTLGDPAHPIRFAGITHLEGSISFALTPKSRGDDDKLSSALARLIEEDPALSTTRDPQTHEILLAGTGLQHVDVTLARMKRKFHVECLMSAPKVPYRETIKRRAEATARHKKQTGGHGQFAECKIVVEPRERGAGYEFQDKIFGGAVSQGYRSAVDKGVHEAASHGPLAGYPMVDFRVQLVDGKEHPVDSSEMAFKIAGSLAFKECMKAAAPIMLEPIMDVEIEAPDEFMGDLMGDLNSRRGRVQGMDTSGSGQVIRAQVPLAEMLTYTQTLKSITGGRGAFHMSMARYDEVPVHIQQKLVQEASKAKQEAE